MKNKTEYALLEEFNLISVGLLRLSEPDQIMEMILRKLEILIPHNKSFFSFELDGKEYHTSLNMSMQELRQYEAYKSHDYTTWFTNQKKSCVYRDSDLVNGMAAKDSVIYQNWIHPMGMEYVCGNIIAEKDISYGTITLLRKKEMDDFTDEEMFIFRLLTQQLSAWFASNTKIVPGKYGALMEQEHAALLTEREKVIVGLICEGYSTRKISEMLTITYETARKHIANIYGKLNINSRVELVRIFINKEYLAK